MKLNFLGVAWFSLAVAEAELGVASFCPGDHAMPHLGSVGDPWQLPALGVRFLEWIYGAGPWCWSSSLAAGRVAALFAGALTDSQRGNNFVSPQILLWAQCLLIPVENQAVVSAMGTEPLLWQCGGESSPDKALKITRIIKENAFPLGFNRKAPLYFGVSQLLYILLNGMRYPSPSWWDWEPAQ